MDWTLDYTARALPALPDAARGIVRRAAGALPGAVVGTGDVLFKGSVTVGLEDGVAGVTQLLDALTGFEQRNQAIRITVSDSLSLVQRDEGGRLVIDLSAADDDDADEWELDDEGEDDDDEEDGTFLDDFLAMTAIEAVPFVEYVPPVPMDPPRAILANLTTLTDHFTLDRVALSRRDSSDGLGAVFIVEGEVLLTSDDIAHLVDADVALLDADGEVLAAETVVLAYDVRRRGELFLECALESAPADAVASVEVGLDAYIRYPIPPLAWSLDDRAPQEASDGRVTLRARGTLSEFPYEAVEATGRLTNESGSYIAAAELTLTAYDRDDDDVTDDEDDLPMIAPNQTRPFRLTAALDDDDAPERLVLGGTYVTRQRYELLKLTLAG